MAAVTDRGLENREIVLDILTEVLEKGSFVHLVLNQALYKYQYLSKADRAFITRAAEGTLEYRLQIDYVINLYSKTKTEKMKPLIRNLLRMSVYQILYMDRVPDSAVCNEAVKLAVKRRFQGLKGFVNGVLRTISREKDKLSFDTPSLKYSIPQWIYDRWKEDWGEETASAICASFLEESPTWIRFNRNLASKEEILASLEKNQAKVCLLNGSETMAALSGYDTLEGLEAFLRGWIQVQDPSSALVGEFAAPEKGSYIIDVCAAPGGKSLHLADKLAGTGMVEARDLTEQKVALIEENMARCSAGNMKARVMDALEFDEASEEKADILIADLPCSGLGIIGKKPDIKYNMTEEKLKSLAELQREILSAVWRYVKPGGLLIYSTCTIDRMENEENAAWFRKNFPFDPVDMTERVPEGLPIPAFSSDTLKEGYVQFLPGRDPFDGFFISMFRRRQQCGN
ncbi:MAG: 16S rRNA (cytosine(967)-C(5))-methyltransferase RsmB [Enterocloster sp.]